MLTLGSGIAATLLALENIRVSGTHWSLVGSFGVAAVLLLAVALRRLLTVPNPLVQLRVLRVQTLRITVSAARCTAW